jgi:hypothetical protein
VGFLSLIICIILIFDDCGVLVLGLEGFRLNCYNMMNCVVDARFYVI